MTRFPIPALALAISCVPTVALRSPQCFTPCGLVAFEGDCESLQFYEQRIVRRLARAVPEWRESKICAELKTFRLEVRHHGLISDATCPVNAWRGDDRCLFGYTTFSPGHETITIADSEWGASALAHEIAHVAEVGNTGSSDPGHCRWTPAFKATLADLSALEDFSEPAPSCPR